MSHCAARNRFNIARLNEALTSTNARETRGQRPEPETSSTSVAQTRFSGCQESSRGRELRRLGPGADGGRGRGGHFGNWELGTWKASHQRKSPSAKQLPAAAALP